MNWIEFVQRGSGTSGKTINGVEETQKEAKSAHSFPRLLSLAGDDPTHKLFKFT